MEPIANQPFDRRSHLGYRKMLERRRDWLERLHADGGGCPPEPDPGPDDDVPFKLALCLLEARVNYLENLSLCWDEASGTCDPECAEKMADQWRFERGMCFTAYSRKTSPVSA